MIAWIDVTDGLAEIKVLNVPIGKSFVCLNFTSLFLLVAVKNPMLIYKHGDVGEGSLPFAVFNEEEISTLHLFRTKA
ncbi:MAG TPA: hypothetical protein VLE89_00335 [Chlamydiales bacterium]|nr:hypothetical protein [Chlamydiales bacterium]